jgi:hypothetical protein
VVAFLLALADRREWTDATIDADGGPRVELAVANGELVRLEGGVHLAALEALRRDGRLEASAEQPEDDEAAALILERLLDAGLVGRFEVDRLLRRARESLVHDVVACREASFTLRVGSARRRGSPRLLGAPFAAVVVEGARRRLDTRRVQKLLGARGTAMRIAASASRARFDALGLEPELLLLLERHDGARVDAWLRAAPPEEGLAGALFALVCAGLVDIGPEPTRAAPEESATAVRAAIEAARALAEEGSYFAILGVDPDASGREIREAYVNRRRWLATLPLEALGLGHFDPLCREALEAIDEAWEILRDSGLREGYAGAVAGRIRA